MLRVSVIRISSQASHSAKRRMFCASFSTVPVSEETMHDMVTAAFPRAIPNSELVAKTTSALTKFGYGETTLLASSLCCDEVSRKLEEDFEPHYGPNFSMVSELYN